MNCYLRRTDLPEPGQVHFRETYFTTHGANPWLSILPVPVFTGDGGYVTECPQMPDSLKDPYADQELYLQQLYLQDPYLKEYNRLHLYWQQLCQQHPQCLPLYWDWKVHSHTSYLSYMEQYRAAFNNIRIEKAVRHQRTTQLLSNMRKRKREAFYVSNLGLGAQAGEAQTLSKRPRLNVLCEEPDTFHAAITKTGEVIFSEPILDLLEGIPNILDLAAEMGFCV
ncbi:uncharacterized protein LOC143485105 [Brachyhypopomus gauderio]|uniref:uncharacterized protein LOC143485105 n=1 Tax=Brachyhypopomus gauderio TaxID=698409 RepID=UPI004041E30F